MKEVKVGKSKIHGKGLFSNEPIKKGDLITKVHAAVKINPELTKFIPNELGKFYNHTDKIANVSNEIIGDGRYLRALKSIPANTELAADYREHSEMEQPEDFDKTKYASFDYDDTFTTPEGLAKAKELFNEGYNLFIISARNEITPEMVLRAQEAGIPRDNIIVTGSDEAKVAKVKALGIQKHFDNKSEVINQLGELGEQFRRGGIKSKKYTSNLLGKNRLFVKNGLLKKKSVKNKIFDPNSPYFEDGGYMDLDLDEEAIIKYKEGGYIIEELDDYDNGGDLPPKVGLSYLPKGERSYYDPIMDNINLDSNASEGELNHEMVHAWQNRQDGFRSDPYTPKLRPSAAASDEQAATYFNRKGDDVDRYLNNLNTIVPELGGHTWNKDIDTFIPDQIKYDKVIDPLMYSDPTTLEGEAEYMAQVYGRPPLEIRKYGGLHRFVKGGEPTSPEEWGQQIKDIEGQIGNPSGWTLSDYNTLQNKLNEYKSWRENTPEGQAVIDTHNEEREYDVPLPEHLQDYTNAMMKARLAYANEFGNPAAKRMINIPDETYEFTGDEPGAGVPAGNTGTHFMSSMDNYAVPWIQQGPNGLYYNQNAGPEDKEAIKFDSDEDANYFAEHYKDVSPGFINEKKEGGASGCPKGEYWNGKKCVKIPKNAFVTKDPFVFKKRLNAYNDSLLVYKQTLNNTKDALNQGFVFDTQNKTLGNKRDVVINSMKKKQANDAIKPVGYKKMIKLKPNQGWTGFVFPDYKLPTQPVIYEKDYKNNVVKKFYPKIKEPVKDPVKEPVMPTTRTVYIDCPPGSVSNGQKTDVTIHDPDSPGNYLRTITTGCDPIKEKEVIIPIKEPVTSTEEVSMGTQDYPEELKGSNWEWDKNWHSFNTPRLNKHFPNGPLFNGKKKHNFSTPALHRRKDYEDGGALNKFIGGGPTDCPKDHVWDSNTKKCVKVYTLANDKKFIDGVGNWAMQSSNPDKISSEYNDQIKHYLYSGKYGYDPVSGTLHPLKKEQKTVADAETKKILAKQDDKAAYTQSIIDAGFDPDTFGKSKGTNVITGEEIYGDKSKEDVDKINKEAVNDFVTEGHKKAVLESPFNTAAFFTPPGMAAGVMQGAVNLLPDIYNFGKDPSWSSAGAVGMDALMMLPAAKGIGKVLGYKGVPKELPGSPNTVDNVQKAGFLNPLALLDRITPRLPAITKVLGMEDDVVNHSPLNLIPGYGKKLAQPGFTHPINSGNTEITAYRKFGNSLDDLKNSKTFRPQGGFRMGAKQIKTEGNWAEAGIANENYKGVFAAGMDPRVAGTNIQLQRWSKRNGVVGMTKQGNPAIPITDPGLEFHRRLPFSNKYVPIDKQKLIDNKFQLATQLPHVQSLIEKYGIAAAYGLISGYLANGKEGAIENLKTVNKYTVDPVINWSNTAWDDLENKLNQKEEGGSMEMDLTREQINEYKKGGWIVEEIEDGGDPDPLDPHQAFLKNWYENRVFPKEMQKAKPILLNQLEQSFPPYVPTDALPTNVAAAYNYDDNIVELNKNYSAELQEGSKTHENNHYLTQDANEYLDKPHTNLIEQNIINPKDINTGNKEWDKAYKENFDEIVSPEEMHSRIMTLRELAGFKPDQVITEKDVEDYFKSVGDKLDPDIQDIKQVTKGNKAIVELLNYMASNNSNEDLNVAKYGGTTDYELGDEIDEDTMKKLKELGYTFEII